MKDPDLVRVLTISRDTTLIRLRDLAAARDLALSRESAFPRDHALSKDPSLSRNPAPCSLGRSQPYGLLSRHNRCLGNSGRININNI